jgi:hypothetical protein
VLEVSFLAFVLLTAATATFISIHQGPRRSRCLTTYILVDHKISRKLRIPGHRDSETQTADKASLYVFTLLFLGHADEVTSRRVSEFSTYAIQGRSVVETVSISIFRIALPYAGRQLPQII